METEEEIGTAEAQALRDELRTELEFQLEEREVEVREKRRRRVAATYLLSAGAMLLKARDEPDWLVPRAIPLDAITYIAGRPGSGKSWLAFDLVVAVAQGREWLGSKPAATGRVLVLSLDSPASETASRFKRLGLLPTDDVFFHSIGAHRPPDDMPPLLTLPAAWNELDAIVEMLRPRLIVIDSMRKVHTVSENDSGEMAKITNALRLLASTGAAVVVIHHTRKPREDGGDDGSELRGSVEIEASADCIIMVKGEGAAGTARWIKTRAWLLESDEQERTWHVGEGRVEPAASVSALIAEYGAMTREQIAEALELEPSTAKSLVDAAIKRGEIKESRRRSADAPRMLELKT